MFSDALFTLAKIRKQQFPSMRMFLVIQAGEVIIKIFYLVVQMDRIKDRNQR